MDEHLERRLASVVEARGGDVVLATIASRQANMQELLEGLKTRPQVKYVLNEAPTSGILHIARNETLAVCGWKYSESGFATVTDKSARHVMCMQCKVTV